MHIINNLQPEISTAEIRKRLHLEKNTEEWSSVEKMIDQAAELIEPKAVYKLCYIDRKEDDAVITQEVRFQSRVLRKNLDDIQRMFPFVVTIGSRLEEKAKTCKDYLEQYYFEIIANVVLQDVIKGLRTALQDKYKMEKLSYMSVGSLEDWPISEQKQLFSLLGDVEAAIGVQLTSSMLMLPAKSESGIFFPSETTFLNCQLCPRQNCEGRKAAFDPKMARDYGLADK
jgi:cobalamin-dependent methionine synthase I